MKEVESGIKEANLSKTSRQNLRRICSKPQAGVKKKAPNTTKVKAKTKSTLQEEAPADSQTRWLDHTLCLDIDFALPTQLVETWKSDPLSFFTSGPGVGESTVTVLGISRLPDLFEHVTRLSKSAVESTCCLRIFKIFYFRLRKVIPLEKHFEFFESSGISRETFQAQMQAWISDGKVLDSLCTSLGCHGAVFYFPNINNS
jgi:hypothetical protein